MVSSPCAKTAVFSARENGQVPMAQPRQVLGCLPDRVLVIDTYILPRNTFPTCAGCFGHPSLLAFRLGVGPGPAHKPKV